MNSDEKLLWYTDKSDEEPANWKQIYYFKNEDAVNVQLKVTQGSLCYKISNGNVTNITNNTALSNLVKSGQILSIFPQDDGVRNITWSDDAFDTKATLFNFKTQAMLTTASSPDTATIPLSPSSIAISENETPKRIITLVLFLI